MYVTDITDPITHEPIIVEGRTNDALIDAIDCKIAEQETLRTKAIENLYLVGAIYPMLCLIVAVALLPYGIALVVLMTASLLCLPPKINPAKRYLYAVRRKRAWRKERDRIDVPDERCANPGK